MRTAVRVRGVRGKEVGMYLGRFVRCGALAALGWVWFGGAAVFAQVPREPVSLERAIGIALRRNPALQAARLGYRVAGQQVREARASLFPDVDAAVRFQRNLAVPEAFLPALIFDPQAPPDELVPVRFGADNNWSAQLTLTQPIFDAAAFVGVGTAGRVRELEAETVRGVAQRVVSEVRRRYYAALLAQEEARVTEESLRRIAAQLEETRALYEAGLAGAYDVLRLEVRLANLRPNVRRAQNAAAAARRALAVAMGLDAAVEVPVAGALHRVDLADPGANEGANAELLRVAGVRDPESALLEDLVAAARRSRSDLRQARVRRELEDARVAYERSQFFPRLSAFVTYGVTAQENGAPDFFGEGPRQRTTTALAGLQVEVPLFTGFARAARLEQRRLARREAEWEVARLELELENEIATALDRVREARLRAEAQRAAVAQARRGYEIATEEMRAGTASQLDVLDAEVALRESEFNYAQAVYDYLVARADLDDAVGAVPGVGASPADVTAADPAGAPPARP